MSENIASRNIPQIDRGTEQELNLKAPAYYSRINIKGTTVENQLIDNLEAFNYIGDICLDDPFLTGYFFVFISTPMLNLEILNAEESKEPGENEFYSDERSKIRKNVHSSPIIRELSFRRPELIQMLNSNDIKIGAGRARPFPFIKLLTNKALNFDLKDTELKQQDLIESRLGYKFKHPTLYIDSVSGGEFTISYRENTHLDVLNLHNIWVEYIQGIKLGYMLPSDNAVNKAYLDYMSSLYYIALKPDMRSITYWAKYTGIAPVGIPHSAFSGKRGDINIVNEIQIPYIYSYKEELNPQILADFNEQMNGKPSGMVIGRVENYDGDKKDAGRYKYVLELVKDNNPAHVITTKENSMMPKQTTLSSGDEGVSNTKVSNRLTAESSTQLSSLGFVRAADGADVSKLNERVRTLNPEQELLMAAHKNKPSGPKYNEYASSNFSNLSLLQSVVEKDHLKVPGIDSENV
jgi:hypothetical protein